MKLNLFLFITFLSILGYASVKFMTGIAGVTKLNGEGCVCHTSDPNQSVNVWVEGPDSLAKGETAQYTIYLSGGPAISGGFNAASRFGDLSPADTSVNKIDDELTHFSPLPFQSADDTISWIFNYTAVSEGLDTIYSVANSVNGNGKPTGDEWNFGNNFPVFISSQIPVELISFSAVSGREGIRLEWQTATESNNKGFEIERHVMSNEHGVVSNENSKWDVIEYVIGNGTTTEYKSYSFTDFKTSAGKYRYRLKQIDFDGMFEYSGVVEAEIFSPSEFALQQNYPNPFNPETFISFNIPDEGYAELKIHNLNGELVDVLLTETISPGNHSKKWDASSFSSGVYFYTLVFENQSGLNFKKTKKMILAK
jgi:hypothetical protein